MPVVTRQEVRKLLDSRRFVILQGPPGTGKTMMALELLSTDYAGSGRSIQFHPNTTYENFIGGLAPEESETQLGLQFRPKPGFLMESAKQAGKTHPTPYLLHIDEINRADLAKILGEAIYLFEPKSAQKREIDLPYDFGEPFHTKLKLPENLQVLGTMNSADRSIAIVDVAVRRRFAFVSLWPQMRVVEEYGCQLMRDAFQRIVSIFIEHAGEDAFPLVPGHSYFLESDEAAAKESLRVNLGPLLEEYLAQGMSPDSPNRFGRTCNGCKASERRQAANYRRSPSTIAASAARTRDLPRITRQLRTREIRSTVLRLT